MINVDEDENENFHPDGKSVDRRRETLRSKPYTLHSKHYPPTALNIGVGHCDVLS